MRLRVGSIGYCTDQGLGVLLKSFYDAEVVTDVMTVAHGRRPEHHEWFPDSRRVHNLNSHLERELMKDFVASMDVMLFFETPFRWPLIDHCRRVGVKTVLMPMFECMPAVLPATPDAFLCPSLLDLRYFPRGTFIPVPVDPKTWKRRTRAEVFVHNAGHGGLKGRNGTAELLAAIPLLKSDAQIIVRTQETLKYGRDSFDRLERFTSPAGNPLVRVSTGDRYKNVPREALYSEGDVFVFPEHFNGLSLPLQEARAAGMLVMGTDRYPMNEWLPTEPLIPVAGYAPDSVSPRCLSFQSAVVTPEAIAAKIDEWYGRDIGAYSDSGREWAEANSWGRLKPRYTEFLEGVVKS